MALGDSLSSVQGPAAPKLGARTGLPLVPCPICGEQIIELTCGQGSKVPGAIFFKCRLHERDVKGSCPWYLFADKYEKMLIGKGMIDKKGVVLSAEESLGQVDQLRLSIGHIEALVQANRTEMSPLLDDLVCVKNGAVRVDEKL